MTQRKVRVRFVSSSTGALYTGGVCMALCNYLFAKQNGGDMILRIEDTDSQRFVPGAGNYIIEALTWLGARPGEGMSSGDSYDPYRQSERRGIYEKYVDQLLNDDHAYITFDTPTELEEKRKEIANFQYDVSIRLQMHDLLTPSPGEVRNLIESGHRHVVRARIESNEDTHVNDLIRGEVVINSLTLDDKVLYRSIDQLPAYHLASIVDDHLTEVIYVIHSREWLPSVPLYILLYRFFGWEGTTPSFAHLSLLLRPEGNGKLSGHDSGHLGLPVSPLGRYNPKMDGALSGCCESGYFPETVVDLLALLGQSPGNGREAASMDDLIRSFDLSCYNKSGVKLDYGKDRWSNHYYLLEKNNTEITDLFLSIMESHNIQTAHAYVEKVVGIMKDCVNSVSELRGLCSFLSIALTEYGEETRRKRWKEGSAVQLEEFIEQLRAHGPFDVEGTEGECKTWIESEGYHSGDIINTARLTLVGEGKGPGIFDIAEALGKEESIRRIQRITEILK